MDNVNLMILCKTCGVELESDMQSCPLCNKSTEDENITGMPVNYESPGSARPVKMNRRQKKLIWEIISITILSFVVVTLSINLILNAKISWSEYPVSFFLVIFSYMSIFTFINKKVWIKLIAGFIMSSLFLVMMDAVSGGMIWAFKLGIPLLISGNLIIGALILIINFSKRKGINLIAFSFIALALFLLSIEAIISLFRTNTIHMLWSIIVLAIILPVAFILFFVHFRVSKKRTLEKMFHI